MNSLVSFEVIQISGFLESLLISRKFALCSLHSFSAVTLKCVHVSIVHLSIDVFALINALFVFLDYREALIDVKWDHGRACDILYPIEK